MLLIHPIQYMYVCMYTRQLSSFKQASLQNFEREIETMKRWQHPNLVSLFEAFQPMGSGVRLMELDRPR